jgi:hypothetical protein
MRLASFLVVAAVVHGLLGLAALIAPGVTAGMFGIALDAGSESIVRLLGATLLGLAMAFWSGRHTDTPRIVQGILFAGFVVNLLSLAVVVMATLGGTMGPSAWVGAAVRALFVAGFGYYAFVRPSTGRAYSN